jgi:hypothetical protein
MNLFQTLSFLLCEPLSEHPALRWQARDTGAGVRDAVGQDAALLHPTPYDQEQSPKEMAISNKNTANGKASAIPGLFNDCRIMSNEFQNENVEIAEGAALGPL